VKLRGGDPIFASSSRAHLFLSIYLNAARWWQPPFEEVGSCFGNFTPSGTHFPWGIPIYISQAVTQDARLIKNLTPSVTVMAYTKASPVRKRVQVLGYIFFYKKW
jgi:hypothetical protein